MKDLTRGNPTKIIIMFALPILAGNILQLLYNISDTYIVGRTLGVNALAAVGSTTVIIRLIFGFIGNIANGFGIHMAQNFGSKNMEKFKESFAGSIILTIIISLMLTLFFTITIAPILRLMKTPAEIFEDAHMYILIVIWSMIISMFERLFASTLRAMGNSKTPIIISSASNVINIALDYTLILVLNLGVTGAAIATNISQLISCIIFVFLIRAKYPDLKITKEHMRVSKRNARALLKIGIPMGFQQSIIELGNIIVQIVINSFGATAVAAVIAAQNIRSIGMKPLFALGTTMANFTAQNYGAEEPKRIRSGVKSALIISTVFSVSIFTIFALIGRNITGLFTTDLDVINLAFQYLIIQGSMLIFLGIMLVFKNTLQGIGKMTAPVISGFGELIISIPAVLLLTPLLGFTSICIASPLAWIFSSIPLVIAYIRLRKKNYDITMS